MKRPKANSQPPAERKTLRQALIFGSAFSLFLVFGSLLLLLAATGDAKQAASYRKSPSCISEVPASSGPPCALLTEHVVSKHREEGARGTANYFVELQSGLAVPQQAEIIDRNCWDQLAAGDPVTAQTWQGHVMSVAAHNRHSMTANNPVYCISSDREILCLITPLTLFFVTLTFLAWKKILRERADQP